MSEWWTYRPEDLLLFSPRTYWRLFERANAELWPLQFAILVVGVLMLIWILRPKPWSDRVISGMMVSAWTITGFHFVGTLYAQINWAAVYAVPVFVAEAAQLLWFGMVRRKVRFLFDRDLHSALGLGLVAYALALHPLIAPLAGRPVMAAEIIGIAPDPTAIATLGLLAMSRPGKAIRLMFLAPGLWCLVSAVTLFTMGAWEGWILLMSVTLTLLAQVLAPSKAHRKP